MKSLSGTKKISLYDNFSDFENMPEGNIQLGVSKDDRIYYDGKGDIETNLQKDIHYFKNYRGTIYIPREVSIIALSTCELSGIIGSPAYIKNDCDNNLIIDKDKGLELIVYNDDAVIINKEVWSYGTGIKESASYTRYGRDFDHLTNLYLQFMTNNADTPIIKRGKDLDYAKFGKGNIHASVIDTCIHHNLVLIYKCAGTACIYYMPPFDNKNLDSIKLHDVKNQLKVLEQQMNGDIDTERYKMIQRKVSTLKKRKDLLSFKVQQEHAIITQKEKEKRHKVKDDKSKPSSADAAASDAEPLEGQQQ